ncbi:hypothetical protein [Desulfobacter latus]|uniref:Uncharacterized protein n=1 Tax=Desulfobacter latus TaxID=2292 RepID=A0A850TEY1_9BACT|nr:hypothetical protein [Desulfobacter latus]NWH05996.1 hypothetical protein [Desulfobacter latus]
MKRILSICLTCVIYLSCWTPDGHSAICLIVRGTVKTVKTMPCLTPEIIVLTQNDDGKVVENKFAVVFAQNDTGCVDWNTPENHLKALVFSLIPGNVVEISYILQSGRKEVKAIKLLSLKSGTLFPGYEKIKHGQLLTDLQVPEPKQTVIILLKGHEKLKERMKRPEERKSVIQQIQALQNKVLKSMPTKVFTPGLILRNIPVISGDATLEGVRMLAANPLVETIESDMPMTLHGDDVQSMEMGGER